MMCLRVGELGRGHRLDPQNTTVGDLLMLEAIHNDILDDKATLVSLCFPYLPPANPSPLHTTASISPA